MPSSDDELKPMTDSLSKYQEEKEAIRVACLKARGAVWNEIRSYYKDYYGKTLPKVKDYSTLKGLVQDLEDQLVHARCEASKLKAEDRAGIHSRIQSLADQFQAAKSQREGILLIYRDVSEKYHRLAMSKVHEICKQMQVTENFKEFVLRAIKMLSDFWSAWREAERAWERAEERAKEREEEAKERAKERAKKSGA
jgi:hypothetical protein